MSEVQSNVFDAESEQWAARWGEKPCSCQEEFGDLVVNVGRHHFAVCERHARYHYCGSNLFSGWREQPEEDWRKAVELFWQATAISAVDALYLAHAEQNYYTSPAMISE
jgi:hypothetical protein